MGNWSIGGWWRVQTAFLIAEPVTSCHGLKMSALDGKHYRNDVADMETMLRIVQGMPSPKAGPVKE